MGSPRVVSNSFINVQPADYPGAGPVGSRLQPRPDCWNQSRRSAVPRGTGPPRRKALLRPQSGLTAAAPQPEARAGPAAAGAARGGYAAHTARPAAAAGPAPLLRSPPPRRCGRRHSRRPDGCGRCCGPPHWPRSRGGAQQRWRRRAGGAARLQSRAAAVPRQRQHSRGGRRGGHRRHGAMATGRPSNWRSDGREECAGGRRSYGLAA
jgi:hypothetical protein